MQQHKVPSAIVAAALLVGAAALWHKRKAVSAWFRARKEKYVPGPGPALDSDVPIKQPLSSWDAFYAFFDRP